MPNVPEITAPASTERSLERLNQTFGNSTFGARIADNLSTEDATIALSALQGVNLRKDRDGIRGETQLYDDTATYAKGAYCIHDNVLWKSNVAIATAENWNSAHWDKVDLKGMNESLTSLNAYEVGDFTTSYTKNSESFIYKVGNVVTVLIYLTVGATVSSSTTLATIPEGFRPPRRVYLTGHLFSGSELTCCNFFRINDDGVVTEAWTSTLTISNVAIVGSYSVI